MRAIIIGCGVSGLSCGIKMQEAGYEVSIWSRDFTPNITSDVAAAVWYPYHAAPIERVSPWSQQTLEVFYELAEVPNTGVNIVEGLELLRTVAEPPVWHRDVKAFRFARESEIIPGYASGYMFETPVIDMSVYLDYLMNRFKGSGGTIEKREVETLNEPLAESQIVVNCAGLGAMTLANDTSMRPGRGQIVRIEKLSSINRFYLDQYNPEGLTYIVPRLNDCVLGGIDEEDSWTIEPDESTAQAIIERCAKLVPEIHSASIIAHVVGLRPIRDTVRLEIDRQDRRHVVIHNYGHGGAGVTLSWGCAAEVLALARRYSI